MVLQWIKELIGFLMISGLFLMLVPHQEIRKFVRLVIGLLLITLMLQPLTGSGILVNIGSTSADLRLHHALRTGQGGMLEVDQLQEQAERLVEKGSGIMREQMVNQTNKQLSSLLRLFPGVRDAQVAAQMGAEGGLQRVVVHLYLAEEAASGDNGSSTRLIEPVAPVLIMGEPLRQDEVASFPQDSLTSRVQSLVADFYGVEPEAVLVSIAG